MHDASAKEVASVQPLDGERCVDNHHVPAPPQEALEGGLESRCVAHHGPELLSHQDASPDRLESGHTELELSPVLFRLVLA